MTKSHVARQPIFRPDLKVEAYELLFRAGVGACFDDYTGEQASTAVLSESFFDAGIGSVTGGAPAFINFTGELILQDVVEIFPPESIVVELLETIEPTEEIIRACRRLKDNGYTLALDDFIYEKKFDPLIELASIIKVDFKLTSPKQQSIYIDHFGKRCQMLAEKVETYEEFDRALKAGYNLFQGFFFSRPVTLNSHSLPANKANAMLLLSEVSRPIDDWKKIEMAIKRDVALSYKLLRYINSSFFGLNNKINSLSQALKLLGVRSVRKWASLVAMSCLVDNKPMELMRHSLVRASMCERLAPATGNAERLNDLFLLGLFSMLDTMLDQPMDSILEEMPLADDLRDALLGKENPLREILDLVVRYERAKWDELQIQAAAHSISVESLPDTYYQAVNWTEQIMSQTMSMSKKA